MKRIASIAMACLLWGAGSAWASGFHTAEFSAAQVGQATGGMTMTENASVIAQLPAAMVRLPGGSNALAGLTLFQPDFQADPVGAGDSASTTTDDTIAPHVYWVQNEQDWAWGVGLYFPFNDVVEWPADWAGRLEVENVEINIGYLSFSGAYAVNDNLSFGGSLLYIRGEATLEKDTDAAAALGVPFVQTVLEADDQRFGINVSAMYDTDTFAIGINHSPKYSLEGEGTLTFDQSDNPGGPAGAIFLAATEQQNIQATLLMPSITEIAASLKDRQQDPNYFVELAVLLTGWSNFREIRVVNTDDNSTTENIEKDWDDTMGIKLSGNYVVSRAGGAAHRVRAGLFLDESPIPAETLAPDVPDGEGRQEIAFGYGYATDSFTFDASYFLIDFEDSTSTDPDFPANYSGDVQILSASVGFRY